MTNPTALNTHPKIDSIDSSIAPAAVTIASMAQHTPVVTHAQATQTTLLIQTHATQTTLEIHIQATQTQLISLQPQEHGHQ
jgi:hypothetical protein